VARKADKPFLVTGATGFIGAALVNGLLARGKRVRALVLPNESTDGLWDGPVEIVAGDITRATDVNAAVEGCSHVYHLVALVSDWGERERVASVTVTGTQHVMEAAKASGTRVILASSIVVYADAIDRDECDEDHPHGEALGVYSWSKQEQEKLAIGYARKNDVPLTVIRPANVIGPRCGPWVDSIVSQLQSGLPALLGDGEQNAGLVCIQNLVELFILAGLKDSAVGRIYNGCDGLNVTWRQYFSDLATLADTQPPRAIPRWVSSGLASACERVWRVTRRSSRPPLTHEAINLVGSHHRIPNMRARLELGFNPPPTSYEDTLTAIAVYIGQSKDV